MKLSDYIIDIRTQIETIFNNSSFVSGIGKDDDAIKTETSPLYWENYTSIKQAGSKAILFVWGLVDIPVAAHSDDSYIGVSPVVEVNILSNKKASDVYSALQTFETQANILGWRIYFYSAPYFDPELNVVKYTFTMKKAVF